MNNIQLGLFSSRINSICKEMGEVLRLSSFSPNIKDRLDFSCAIFNAQGKLFAQAAHIPVHLGSMAFAMQDVVGKIDWFDGDTVVFNNPFAGGTHLPDVTLVSPVFIEQQLCAFIVNRAHHADIGANSPGSMPLSQHIDEEGLLISPLKIIQKNTLDQPKMDSILQHMSCRKTSFGDFTAQISANKTGITRLGKIIKVLGLNNFAKAISQLNQYAQRIALATIKELPQGRYSFTDYLEDDGFNQQLLAIKASIEIKDHQVIIDFSGTSGRVKGNVNCPLSVTAAAVYYVFRCLMPTHTPSCAGTFNFIKIKTADNCLINAQYPSAVAAGNVETSTRIVDVILGALAQAIPLKIPAASYGTMNNIAMGNNTAKGNNILSSNYWNYYETIGGGLGASYLAHGCHAQQAHMTNTLNTPIESLESHYPVRITQYSLHKNIQAKGEHLGGDGIIRSFQFLNDTSVTLLTERRKIAPWGLNSASNGKLGENLLDGKLLDGKVQIEVLKGQCLTIKTPTGGSWNK